MRWFSPRLPTLAAVTSGLLLAAAFPPVSLGQLSCVALVPLLVALHRGANRPRVFFKTGYFFGVTFFGAHLWWVVRLSPASSVTIPWLMAPATVALILYLSVYPGLFFLLLRWIGRGRKALLVFLGPALWVLVEWFRSSGELGFPWGSMGYSLVRFPLMVQGAAVVGVLGLGALIVFENVVWSMALISKSFRARSFLFAAGLAVLTLNFLGGKTAIERFDSTKPDDRFTVALVQPNVDLALKWNPQFTDSTFGLIERLARKAAGFDPVLVVFPETAAPVYIRYDHGYKRRLEKLARSLGTEIFIGFLDARYDGPKGALNVYNSSGLFRPDGALAQYDKIHLLPFGEMIPFGWKFRVLQRINFGQANFQPGPDASPLSSSVGRLAGLVCFESTFPSLSRKAAARGADVFVNITNDGWFGHTPGPYQHSDMAILRSVENRRFLLRSGNTGVTMVVDPVGRVTAALEMDQEGVLSAKIHHVGGEAFYTRYGDWTIVLPSLAVVLLGLLTGPLAFRERSRRRE